MASSTPLRHVLSSKRIIVIFSLLLATLFIYTTSPRTRLAEASANWGAPKSWNDVPYLSKEENAGEAREMSVPSEEEWDAKASVESPARLDDEDLLAYRQHLEETTSPAHFKHSRTLTFTHIYVLSLAKRTDRRERMSKIARALGLELTFVDAMDKADPAMGWIGERVAETRKKKVKLIAKAREVDKSTIGGGGIESVWLEGMDVEDLRLPSLAEKRWKGKDWVTYLSEADPATLRPRPGFNVSEALYDPNEDNERRQLTEPVLATWFSHVKVAKTMEENGDESALVLEDDVDLEWDIGRLWANAHRRLPPDWEVAFLGTCWGRENEQPAYLHPNLHQSTRPRCLHGYALSRMGYTRFLSALADPWIAYQGAVDTAVAALVGRSALYSFSIEPSLIVQTKDVTSDIQAGIGSEWRGVLADSTLERILRDEGHAVPDPIFDIEHLDPAVLYRPRPKSWTAALPTRAAAPPAALTSAPPLVKSKWSAQHRPGAGEVEKSRSVLGAARKVGATMGGVPLSEASSAGLFDPPVDSEAVVSEREGHEMIRMIKEVRTGVGARVEPSAVKEDVGGAGRAEGDEGERGSSWQ